MIEKIKVMDANRVGLGIGNPDGAWITGRFRVWTSRGGLPVAALRRADGSSIYELEGYNALTDEMKNIIRNYVFRLTGGTSEAAELFTAGPYIGLATNTISASATLGSGVTEASGNGYTARALPTWTAGSTGQANNTASAASWTASGGNLGGGSLASLFVTHAASTTGTSPNDRLISFMALNGGPYTVATGNTLNVTYTWTVS